MKPIFPLAIFLLPFSFCLAEPLPRGHVFFAEDFEAPAALSRWAGHAEIEAGPTLTHLAKIERKDDKVPSGTISIKLPVEQMRGYQVFGSARIRGQGISRKPNPWNGVKFMLAVEAPSGRQWPQAQGIPEGSFEVQTFKLSYRVPKDATAITLVLGLEQVTGTVWFDNLRITAGKPPLVEIPPAPADKPIYTGHALPRLRGAMISPSIDEAGLRTLGQEWNANLIRWQLIRGGTKPGQAPAADTFDPWLQGELAKLDKALPLCEKYGISVVLDLHSPPGGKGTSGGYQGSDSGLFNSKEAQAKFVDAWRYMAKRYKGSRMIWGYDLANEPVEDLLADDCDDWHDLAARTAKAVREIDPERTIIIEPAPWGGPEGLADFQPIDVRNVVYSVHMYLPHQFTHQGVFGPSGPVVYPGLIAGKQWDKAALEEALRPAIEFQRKYRVQIYLGEFSAIRWAPDNSGQRYLRDCIDIFEKYGWDWSYHAFREWSGWSVEYTENHDDNKPAASPTDRQKLLCEWFAKNRKPGQ
ncbi:MAG: cellulase family glycosylhydrolase [Tepidisphaeraceae bacterium]|jgi:hypothetical protein